MKNKNENHNRIPVDIDDAREHLHSALKECLGVIKRMGGGLGTLSLYLHSAAGALGGRVRDGGKIDWVPRREEEYLSEFLAKTHFTLTATESNGGRLWLLYCRAWGFFRPIGRWHMAYLHWEQVEGLPNAKRRDAGHAYLCRGVCERER